VTRVRNETALQRKGFLQRCDRPARCEEADQSGDQDADGPRDQQPVTQQCVIIIATGGVGRVARMQQWPHHEGQHGDDDHDRYAGYGDLPCHPATGGADDGGIGVTRRVPAHRHEAVHSLRSDTGKVMVARHFGVAAITRSRWAP
jgi:hypothetical protein